MSAMKLLQLAPPSTSEDELIRRAQSGDMDAIESNECRAPVADSENALLNRIMVEKVMQALSELSSQQRLIFLLKHHEGMTYEEIAKAVGCSTGTAKKSMSRAVVKLREHLNVDVQSTTTLNALQIGV